MARAVVAVFVALLALQWTVGQADAAGQEPLLLAVPPFETLSAERHFQEMVAFVDELFRGMQFTSLMGRGVESTLNQFTATLAFDATSTASSNGLSTHTSSSFLGNLARDVEVGLAIDGTFSTSVAPDAEPEVQQAAVLNPDGTWEVKNEICTELPSRNVTLYGQILSMPDVGAQPCPAATGVDDSCELLAFSADGITADAYVYTVDGAVVPLAVYVTMEIAGEGTDFVNNIQLVFTDYDLTAELDSSDFDMPDACNRAFYESCDALAEPATMEFYLFSYEAPIDIDLSDTGAGDIHAAAADMCSNSFMAAQNDTVGYVVRVSAVVDKNFDMMHAKNGEGRVQHSGALYYGDSDYAGQCSDNEDIGNWFFFPAEGMCGEGEAVGDSPCYWEAAFNATTIPISCFLDSGIQAACAEDYQLPFTSASNFVAGVFDADGTDDACAPIVSNSPSVPVVADDGDGDDGEGGDDDDLQDAGWYWLAAVLTVGCIVLAVIVVALAVLAFKFKDRLMEIPAFAMLAREPQPGDDYDSTQWKTLSEGGSNGLLDGDLIDDDDLDLTFD